MKRHPSDPNEKKGLKANPARIFLLIVTLVLSYAANAQIAYSPLPALTTNNTDYGDITVPNYKSLTITALNAKFGTIIVEPFAQLIIKNTTIFMRKKLLYSRAVFYTAEWMIPK